MGAPGRCLLFISLVGARVACAAAPLDDWGGSLALTNDYVNHGISQTCGDPAAQGGLHYRSAGGESADEFFAGAWGSAGVGQSACGRSREANFYAGYSALLGQDSGAQVTYTHYDYPGGSYNIGALGGYRYDYDALELQWAWQDLVYLTAAWTPDAFRFAGYGPRRDRNAFAYGLQLHHPLPAGFGLSAGVGYDEVPDPSGAGYAFFNAGLAYSWGPVQIQAQYFGTSTRAVRLFGSYVAGSRVSLSAVWRIR